MDDLALALWLFFGGLAVGLFLLFLLLREFWTWYWKQSEQTRLLQEIAASLRRLEEQGLAAQGVGLPLGAPPPPRRPLPPHPARASRAA